MALVYRPLRLVWLFPINAPRRALLQGLSRPQLVASTARLSHESRAFFMSAAGKCVKIYCSLLTAQAWPTRTAKAPTCHKGVLQNPRRYGKGCQDPSHGERFSTLKAHYTGLCKELRGSRDTAKRGSASDLASERETSRRQ